MDQHINTRLLTCRYWALGPCCPNINADGFEACPFAHWDTGLLASQFQQRGTCAFWEQGYCKMGDGCYYEHRHTGVPGLYQGAIILSGMNLEIANAAQQSGFNTFNHQALMDLIWAVKRIGLRNNRPNGTNPPPKHPIYPDRYRPSGVGDNTKRKRNVPVTTSPPPFHQISTLGSSKNRKKRNRGKRKGRHFRVDVSALDKVLGPARIQKTMPEKKLVVIPLVKHELGTQAKPINLLSDSEDEYSRRSAKRQKLPMRLGKHQARSPHKAHVIKDDFLIDSAPNGKGNTRLEMTTIMKGVKKNLEAAKKSMIDCHLTMRTLFNRNDTILGEDGIFSLMENLSAEIWKAHDGAKEGVVQVDKSITWLETKHVNTKPGMS